MNERLVARVSKSKTIGLVLIAVGFVAIGIWMVADPEPNRRIGVAALVWGLGWLSIVFFGACGLIGARQLFRRTSVLEIDEQGILWRRWSDQIIPWSAVVRAEPSSVYRQNFLCLWLDAPERYPSRSTLGKLSGLNKGMGFGDIALSMQGTDQSFERLVEVVDAHLASRDHRVGTGSAPE